MDKKYSLAILIPVYDRIEDETQEFIDAIKADERFEVDVLKAKSSSIVANRNNLFSRYLKESNKENALCLDTDNYTTVDDLVKMIELQRDVVFGIYKNKYDENEYLAGTFKYDLNDNKFEQQYNIKVGEENKLIDWAGMGLCLFKRDVIEKLRYPYIAQPVVTMKNEESNVMLEDVYFCHQLISYGNQIYPYFSEHIKHIQKSEDKKINKISKGIITLELHESIVALLVKGIKLVPLAYDTTTEILKELQNQINKNRI